MWGCRMVEREGARFCLDRVDPLRDLSVSVSMAFPILGLGMHIEWAEGLVYGQAPNSMPTLGVPCVSVDRSMGPASMFRVFVGCGTRF